MPADDLIAVVSLDSPRALIPGGDATFGIEHDDRVIVDRVDQQPKHLLAFVAGANFGRHIERKDDDPFHHLSLREDRLVDEIEEAFLRSAAIAALQHRP